MLFDFTDPVAVDAWRAIDDRIMGGTSQSRLRFDPQGHAVFEGEVSLQHNGGFASVRSRPGARGQPGATDCLIVASGAGKQYKVSFLTDDGVDSLNYQASFTPTPDGWQTLHLPLAGFRPTWRGREVLAAPPLDPTHIRQVGLLIAASQAGPFSLAIRSITLS